MITKERASRLEGSFGKEKEHYHLKKLKLEQKKQKFFGYSLVSMPPMLYKLEDECLIIRDLA